MTPRDLTIVQVELVLGVLVLGVITRAAGGRDGFWKRYLIYGAVGIFGAVAFMIIAVFSAPLYRGLLGGFLDFQGNLISRMGLTGARNVFDASLEFTIPAVVLYAGMGAATLVLWRKRRRRNG